MAFLDTPINAADLPVGQSGNFEPLPAGDCLSCISVASSVLWLRELSKLLLRAFRAG